MSVIGAMAVPRPQTAHEWRLNLKKAAQAVADADPPLHRGEHIGAALIACAEGEAYNRCGTTSNGARSRITLTYAATRLRHIKARLMELQLPSIARIDLKEGQGTAHSKLTIVLHPKPNA